MNHPQHWRTPVALAAALLAAAAVHAGEIAPELRERLAQRAPADDVRVIVQLAERENLASFRDADRAQRLKGVLRALKARALRTQPAVELRARALGGRNLKPLWVINAIAVTLPAARVRQLAGHPAVLVIREDSLMQAPQTSAGSSAPPEWNLSAIKAPDLWALGYTGSGVVVGSLDTGVDADHPDLAAKYRGGTNSWFDPHGEHLTPYDASGHGTQTMGVMVGGSTSGTAIGVAPDARWIAVKQYDDAGFTSFSHIHLGFQWLLDPDLDPETDDAPHVVNASWGFTGTSGRCVTEFDEDIGVLKAAGIAVAFAAGNEGPAPATSVSPANNPQGFATGALDAANVVANFSSRGPSACDGSVYPAVAAPGVNIYTSDLSFGGMPLYMNVDGTSYAAPHAAGAMALLAGAFPDASVAQIEGALRDGAQDLGVEGADNSYGSGLVDVLAAYGMLGGGTNTPPQITSTPVAAATQGIAYGYDVEATDADGDALGFSLAQAPAGMAIDAASGMIAWTPSAAQVGSQAVTVRVTDARGLNTSQSFTIAVANVNDPPVANGESYQAVQGGTLARAAPGVLGNDSDADGDALAAQVESGPSNGTLGLNANGGFSYAPAPGFSGPDSFGYRARDPSGAVSDVATVSISVLANRPPVAVDNNFSVPRRTTSSYTARILAVLSNDSDPDTALDPANRIDPPTLSIVSGPDSGGTATVITSGAYAGRISYRPGIGFRGTETLTYRVMDTRGASSNTATVRINVY